MKSIEELKAEEARIRKILDGGAEAELRAIPGVVHVSVGLKQINGMATDQFSIRVYVAAKKDPSAIPPAERIPKSIQGVPTDVNQLKVIKPQDDEARYRPITGGIQITIGDGDATLGCLATDNLDGKTVLLTNKHVIGDVAGVLVYQPTVDPANRIGVVKRGLLSPTIDAAIAEIDAAVTTSVNEIKGLFTGGLNRIAGVTDGVSGMLVRKVGAASGLTVGKVVDADAAGSFQDPPHPDEVLSKLLLVQPTMESTCCCCTCHPVDTSARFSRAGDSGSIIVSEQRMAVGLHVGGAGDESYACRMSEVERQLNITINRVVVIAAESAHVDANSARLPSVEDESVWGIMQRRMEETPFGREVGEQLRIHLPEGIDLVNHHRAVMVTWQRVQGPAFLAQWMNGVRNPSFTVAKEINGITMTSALLKLSTVLKEYGSPALAQSIDSYGLELMGLLDKSETVDALMENISKPLLV